MTADEARQAINVLALFLGADVVEFNPAGLRTEADVRGWYAAEPGERPQLLFPAGQDPAERVRTAQMIVRKLVDA